MRLKEFLIRLCVILPIAMWAVFLFLMLFGIVSYFFGADDWFYCTIYCKIGIALFALVALGVTYCQAKACLKNK